MTVDSKKEEVIGRIEALRARVQSYADLLDESQDPISLRVERNHTQVQDERRKLVADYSAVEEIIQKFGNQPRMSDGVWNVAYSPYANAFTADTLARVRPSVDAVVDDLNIVLGRLTAASDSAFVNAMESRDAQPPQNQSDLGLWHYSNPFWLGWSLLLWMWRHKLISGIATAVLAPLAVAFAVHWLRWN